MTPINTIKERREREKEKARVNANMRLVFFFSCCNVALTSILGSERLLTENNICAVMYI